MKQAVFLLSAILSVSALAETDSLTGWSTPANAERTGSEIQIDASGKKNGALMWGPFRKVGEQKVWMLQVKLSGKGEIQGSLGCYSADKKRFLARHPFAQGTRKISSDEVREEEWYLVLPQKPENGSEKTKNHLDNPSKPAIIIWPARMDSLSRPGKYPCSHLRMRAN